MPLVNIYRHGRCISYLSKFYMQWFTKEYEMRCLFYEKWGRCAMCMCNSYHQYETTFSLHILLSTKPFGLPFPFPLKADDSIRFQSLWVITSTLWFKFSVSNPALMSSPRSWVSARGMWKVEGEPALLLLQKWLLLCGCGQYPPGLCGFGSQQLAALPSGRWPS